ncbi:MAG: hypothetical protein PUD53_06755 [Oscillospiraceae bacterium]|nr:hypothetical protein [Oscillospiraceae bacterium]
MKEYKTPEIEMIKYDVEECLTGSTEIPKEAEDIGSMLSELI